MRHPFTRDQQVRCIRAPEVGIPIKEGQTYTVASTFRGNQQHHEATIAGMEKVPGITVKEVGGYYTADRFEAVTV